MIWPFENDISAVISKLAERSMKSEKRRNLMVIIAVALAAFLICFTGIASSSVTQMQRNLVFDTYEAVYTGVGESDIETLKGLPEFSRVGGYYLLGQEHSQQGYNASYLYCDEEMMYIARGQMELSEGRLPEKADEIATSEYFLSNYGSQAKIGETVVLDTESFHGTYTITGIMDAVGEKEANTCIFVVSKEALKEWDSYHPAGYRAYVHFKNDRSLNEEMMASYCRQIAQDYNLPVPGLNRNYFKYYGQAWDTGMIAGVAVLALFGGYIVIQSIFRISVNDKIQSYGQLRTLGATKRQIRGIVKKEGRRFGNIGILFGVVLGICSGLVFFPKGFNALFYAGSVLLTALACRVMVVVSIRRPIKIAAGISPLEAVRFLPAQEKIRSRKKNLKLHPVSMGIANFKRDRKKAVSIVVSISLGGIILLLASSVLLTRSPEQCARLFFPDGDYKIYLDSEQPEAEVMAAGNPLDESLKQEILSVDGVTDIIEKRQAVHAKIAGNSNTDSGMCDMLTGKNRTEVEQALISGVMPDNAHSILIPSRVAQYYEDMNVGAVVEFSFAQKSVPVVISGIYDSKRIVNGHGVLGMDGTSFLAPEELFYELLPEIKHFDYSWNIVSDPRKAENVENRLNEIVLAHSNIGLDVIGTRIAYEKMQNKIVLGSIQGFSWLLFLFGVVNLINATLSNQISRKRENYILRSVGMTRKQLCQMNIYEGLCYASFAAAAILIVGLPIAAVVCREVSRLSFAGKVVPYQFPALEMGLFILVLFSIELFLSVWTVHRQKRQSLMEQLHA